jgi:hypothetical protein
MAGFIFAAGADRVCKLYQEQWLTRRQTGARNTVTSGPKSVSPS